MKVCYKGNSSALFPFNYYKQMKFNLNNQTKENPANLLRSLGYFLKENRGAELGFIKPLGRNSFPRFHLFLKESEANLHLDQKAPIYNKQTAHSGEYEENNPLLIEEAERIKNLFHA